MIPATIFGISTTKLAPGNATVAGLIWILLGLIPLVIGVLFELEGILALKHQPLITLYIRAFRTIHPLIVEFLFLAILVGATAAFVHFVVDGSK